jgi:putative ABC transport system substrate-binding protein
VISSIGRRAVLTTLGGAAGSSLLGPRAPRAQQPALPVVGFLHGSSAAGYASSLAAFQDGLRESGYIDGQNIAIEYRWADGRYDRLADLAADLLRRNVAVIVAAPLPAAVAAKQATATVPIVFEGGADPVRFGLVASLNRPGGHITGIVNLSNTLLPKRIELMHQAVPDARIIAVLLNPNNPNFDAQMKDLGAAQQELGVEIRFLQARIASEIETAFTKLAALGAGALVVGSDGLLTSQWQEIAAMATRHAVPTIHQLRDFVRAGGLMSYGADLTDAYHLTGVYAGRILKGEKPADLPVQESTKVELVINLKTAKTLGLTFPLPLLGRADEVIE